MPQVALRKMVRRCGQPRALLLMCEAGHYRYLRHSGGAVFDVKALAAQLL